MKIKNAFIGGLIALALVSCGEDTRLKVLSPTGAPAISLYSLAVNGDYIYETTTNPKDGLLPNFKNNKYDIIVAPTNGGLMQIKQGANYKLAATVTFGNFYITASGRDADETLNSGDRILLFQENEIPDLVFKYVYGDLGLNVDYVADAEKTKEAIQNNYSVKISETETVFYDYIFTAQPVISATNSTIFKDVQSEFKAKSGGLGITQASIFVNNLANKEKVNKFLDEIKTSISAGLENPELIKTEIEKLGPVKEQQNLYGVPGAMAFKVTKANNGFSLGFKRALEIKNEIESFVNLVTGNKYGVLSEEVIYQ